LTPRQAKWELDMIASSFVEVERDLHGLNVGLEEFQEV
jgi:hypothetical protein